MAKIKRWKKGDIVRADKLNDMVDAGDRLGRISCDPPLDVIDTPSGFHFRVTGQIEFFAKITGGTNPYAWTEQVPAAAGTFEDAAGGTTGTTTADPAYEFTGNMTVANGTIVRLQRAMQTNELLFVYGEC